MLTNPWEAPEGTHLSRDLSEGVSQLFFGGALV